MRRKRVTHNIDKMAVCYAKQLTSSGIRKQALTDLHMLASLFTTPGQNIEIGIRQGRTTNWQPLTDIEIDNYHNYVQHLMKRYDSLRAIHPKKFHREWVHFEQFVPKSEVVCKLNINGQKGDSLADRIVKCMRYDKVRERVFPKYIRELEICTCVYCNATYAVTDIRGNAFYDLDHWKPKSYYPFLCTSFYNLQPSCPSCNRRKSYKDDKVFFNLWDDVGCKNLDILEFKLTPLSLATYLTSLDRNDLEIKFIQNDSRYKKMAEDMDDSLHINTKYAEHRDILEEIVWKHQIYNQSYITSLRKSLGSIVPSDADVNRFILGTYTDADDVFKRPLARMIQNIAHDIGLL